MREITSRKIIMDVSIIIVNYNTKELTRNCLKSVFEQTDGIAFEVIVSDNGSTDGSQEMIRAEFPEVVLIENGANIGFGAANNRALAVARGKYVFYLNSDTVLLNNAVKMFFDFWENSSEKENIGALGGVLLDENMDTIHSGAPFPTYALLCKGQFNYIKSHVFRTLLHVLHLDGAWQKRKDAISMRISVRTGETHGDITGADLFLLNDSNARFDKHFFMYLEETDLELRLAEQGLKRFIIAGPKIQHLTRKIGGKDFVVKFQHVCVQESAVYYARKNFGSKARLLRFLVWLDRLNPLVRKMVGRIPVREL